MCSPIYKTDYTTIYELNTIEDAIRLGNGTIWGIPDPEIEGNLFEVERRLGPIYHIEANGNKYHLQCNLCVLLDGNGESYDDSDSRLTQDLLDFIINHKVMTVEDVELCLEHKCVVPEDITPFFRKVMAKIVDCDDYSLVNIALKIFMDSDKELYNGRMLPYYDHFAAYKKNDTY